MRVSRWRFIENFAHKSLKKWSFGLKQWSLIKSGGLYASIWYANTNTYLTTLIQLGVSHIRNICKCCHVVIIHQFFHHWFETIFRVDWKVLYKVISINSIIIRTRICISYYFSKCLVPTPSSNSVNREYTYVGK